MPRLLFCLILGSALGSLYSQSLADESTSVENQPFANMPVNQWIKISPLPTAPPSPRMGYEGDCVWDSLRDRLIRYGGHNQGGGGEQNSELWLFDPASARWSLTHPNIQPPGVCCAQQNIFDSVSGHYIRFPAFSHSHGWQWMREVYLNNTSVWTFDPDRMRWRNMRPYPSPYPQSLRCASWDTDLQVLVLFGGESSSEGTWIYHPRTNTWTDMAPPQEPMFRSSGNMVYDSRNKRHVLFGAQYKEDPHTWAYDVRTNRWHDRQPPTMPPTKANDAVLAYDAANGVVLAVIKQTVGEWETAKHTMSTWAYDLEKNQWTKMSPETEVDPSSDRCRDMMFATRWNIALLENRTAADPGDEDGPPRGRTTNLGLSIRITYPPGCIAATNRFDGSNHCQFGHLEMEACAEHNGLHGSSTRKICHLPIGW